VVLAPIPDEAVEVAAESPKMLKPKNILDKEEAAAKREDEDKADLKDKVKFKLVRPLIRMLSPRNKLKPLPRRLKTFQLLRPLNPLKPRRESRLKRRASKLKAKPSLSNPSRRRIRDKGKRHQPRDKSKANKPRDKSKEPNPPNKPKNKPPSKRDRDNRKEDKSKPSNKEDKDKTRDKRSKMEVLTLSKSWFKRMELLSSKPPWPKMSTF
jgi:hypothetical protein